MIWNRDGTYGLVGRDAAGRVGRPGTLGTDGSLGRSSWGTGGGRKSPDARTHAVAAYKHRSIALGL